MSFTFLLAIMRIKKVISPPQNSAKNALFPAANITLKETTYAYADLRQGEATDLDLKAYEDSYK